MAAPMVRQAHDVASGQLGDINQMHVEFMQDWMTPPDSDKAEHVKWRRPKASGPTIVPAISHTCCKWPGL